MRRIALLSTLALTGCATTPPEPLSRVHRPADAAPSVVAPSSVRSVEAWEFAGSTGKTIRTDHYRLFTTATRPILISRLPGFLEASLTHYRTSLADAPLPSPPVKLDTYVMNTRPEWATLTRALMRERAPLYLRIERGGFAAAGRGVYRDLGDLNDTFNLAAHEGWHQYTQLTFKGRLPAYLEEGIATYMEGFQWHPYQPDRPVFRPWANMERFRTLRTAAQARRLLSLQELVRTTPQELIQRDQDMALVWYAQVWALVHYLNEGDNGAHKSGLDQLLTDTASGDFSSTRASLRSRHSRQPQGTLFERYFDATAQQLNPGYQRFIARVIAPGGQDAVAAGISPL